MSKDFTVYVVDLSPYMGRESKDGGGRLTVLETGLKAVYDNLNGRMIKFRASDRIAFVLCHSTKTDNDHATESSLRNIEVIGANAAFTYSEYEAIHSKLVVNSNERVETEGSIGEAVVVAIGLFKATEKLKYNRNLVVITSSDAAVDVELPLVEASSNAIKKLDISLVINMVEAAESASRSAEWLEYASKLGGQLVDAALANSRLQHAPLLRKVKPIAMYQGPMKFGPDPNLDSADPQNDDQFTLSFDVCVYPAAKIESMPSLTLYYVDKDTGLTEKVKYQTSYHIRKYHEKEVTNATEANDYEEDEQQAPPKLVDEEEDDAFERPYTTIPVAKGDWEEGFKYSTYDFIAITKPLLESATYSTDPGISICAFIHQSKVPYGMLTEASNYVIPSRPSKVFCSLVEALMQEEKVAVAQFVPKSDDEKQLTVLFPVKLQTGPTSVVYGFIQVRLPFREDAKMGRFPSLTRAYKTLGTADGEDNPMAKFLPNEEELDLMKRFITSKDLDTKHNKVESINNVGNSKLTMKDTEFFPFPKDDDDRVNQRTFLQSSPALAKYTACLKRIIGKSFGKDYHELVNDKEFISKYLLNDKGTNLYTINTINGVNNNRSLDQLSAKLIEELNVEYVKKVTSDGSKRRRGDNINATYNNMVKLDEGNFEEILDLEDLLR
ncbi:ATP-dependent DNA helicase II subunit 2 [Scheffersomyces spartinae]|uniref:DNA helicase n=1 Tax=Scheffersomyces spartinae TaxID=45513 RepID=A0A9P7V5M9_9ASCO|nr:ATP-dependent DNA helicase II subunit 2 [Scheffersomyces spartinae]KAG7191389.1 ATP-dependent DNA helicase II subunit 2 [Scheffersomyces spartinae]